LPDRIALTTIIVDLIKIKKVNIKESVRNI